MTTTIEAPLRPSRPRDVSVLAWLRLIRVFQRVEQITSRGLRCADLSLAHFDVLMHVGASEGLSQQELADSLLVTKGNVCQLLGRMEEVELIERHHEGRTNHVYLTYKGRDIYHQVGPAHEKRVAGCFAALSTDELHELLRLLRRVDQSLGPAGCDRQFDLDCESA